MARPYSEKFLLNLYKADTKRIGVQLARACVAANLPTSYVADAFKVSRMSIHSWFRGQYVRDKNYTKIENFISIVNKGLSDGELPAFNNAAAKDFVSSKVIDKI
jgi:hypothetical protein